MAIRVLLTGFDQAVKALGPTVVAGLEAYSAKHSLEIEASWKQGATPEEAASANVVVLNPASRNRDYDNAILAAAAGLSYRVFILADTWLAWRRVAKEHLADVSGTNVCFKGEIEAAYAHGYKNVSVIIPPHWGAMYEGIVKTVVVGPDVELPLADGESRRRGEMQLVYFGGAKNPPLMNNILGAIAKNLPANGVLCFRPHPAEGADETTLAQRAAFLKGVRMLDHKAAGLDGSNPMVRNADVSIFVGGPTDSIGGAYARRPMIYFDDPEVVAHNLRQDLPNGKWFVPELGGAIYAGEHDLGAKIELLLANPDMLRGKQEMNFPLPATWDTGETLAEAILHS